MSDFADAAGVLASLSSFSRMLFSFEMMRREVIVLGVAIAGRRLGGGDVCSIQVTARQRSRGERVKWISDLHWRDPI
jgi:hypothetical protein